MCKRAVDGFAPFVDYVTVRLLENPHLRSITLFEELVALGFADSYPSLARQVRARGMRPSCAACTGQHNAIIDHPAGAETQRECPDLRNPPAACGWGKAAHLLVGSLAHSGKWRVVLAPSMD